MGFNKRLPDRKVAKRKKFLPPFAAVELLTVESLEWSKLNKMEAHVYNTLKTFYRGKDRKCFRASFDRIKKRSRIKQGRSINRAIRGLEQKGWIEVVRYSKHGYRKALGVKPNEYNLTFRFDRMRW
jgi:hypothetical protein